MESIRNFLNRLLPKGSAMRHVSILAGGTTIAQGLNVAIMPVLSRIYSPSDFGVMAVFVSVTAILTELSGFRYHLAIPLPKHERYAKALVVLSFFLQEVFVVFISLILLVVGKSMLAKLSLDSLVPYRYLIPVGVAGMGGYLVLTQWAIREKLFDAIARTRVTQSLTGAATMIVMGFLGLRPFGLLIGKIIGQAGGITTLARSILKQKGFPKPPVEDIKRVAVRYRKFPMFETWSGILNTMGAQITPILLVALFNPEVAGFFAMAQNLLILPSAFVGLAIGQVFIQKASVARYEGRLKEVTMKAYSMLFQLGLFPILLLSLFSPVIFSYFLGARWVEAGFFARIMGLWVALAFVCSPMDVLFSVMDIQGIRLFVEAFQTLFRMLAIYIGGKIGGPYWAIGLFSLVGVAVYLVKLFILLRVSGNKMDEIFEKLIKKILVTFSLLSLPVLAVIFRISLLAQLIAAFVSLTLFLLLICVPIFKKHGL